VRRRSPWRSGPESLSLERADGGRSGCPKHAIRRNRRVLLDIAVRGSTCAACAPDPNRDPSFDVPARDARAGRKRRSLRRHGPHDMKAADLPDCASGVRGRPPKYCPSGVGKFADRRVMTHLLREWSLRKSQPDLLVRDVVHCLTGHSKSLQYSGWKIRKRPRTRPAGARFRAIPAEFDPRSRTCRLQRQSAFL